MCRQGFCSLIGISSRRVSRCAKSYRGLDIRTLAVSRGETKAPSVRSFLSNMYFSAGELMPHEWSEQQDFSFEKAVASLWEPPSAKLGLLQPAELVRRFLPLGGSRISSGCTTAFALPRAWPQRQLRPSATSGGGNIGINVSGSANSQHTLCAPHATPSAPRSSGRLGPDE